MDLFIDQKRLTEILLIFRNNRGWGKHHTGNELARALTIEATELNRLFMWGEEPDASNENLKEEIADIAIYLLYLADRYVINIGEAVIEKIEKTQLNINYNNFRR